MTSQPPLTKQLILDLLESRREEFLDSIEGLSPDEMELPGVTGEWSVKDILSHISRWEAESVKTLFQAHSGMKPTSALTTTNDANVDTVNHTWFLEGRDRPLEAVLDDFHAVRSQTILRVEEFSARDLLDPLRFSWMHKRPLATWIANNTYEHETEHKATIQAWRKKRS